MEGGDREKKQIIRLIDTKMKGYLLMIMYIVMSLS